MINEGSCFAQLRDNGGKEISIVAYIEELCKKADLIVSHGMESNSIVMNEIFHYNDGNMEVNNSNGYFSNLIAGKRQICTMKECTTLCKLKSIVVNTYQWSSLSEAYFVVTNGEKLMSNTYGDSLEDIKACVTIFKFLVENKYMRLPPSAL